MPRPEPRRQGPSLAIIANGQAYLFDAGVGIVRQAAAAYQQGISALRPNGLDIAFLTHLHTDHTLGLSDLIFTPWVMGRSAPLRLYGPSGTAQMARDILNAYRQDISIRTTGLEHSNQTGYKVLAHDIKAGVVYQDPNVHVTAFLVRHGSWPEAYGYRIDADSKSIVVSGDTGPAESVVRACDGCDLLIHEVYDGSSSANTAGPAWMKYMAAFHTSALQLADIATRARAKMLVVVHYVPLDRLDQEKLMEDIKSRYPGPVIIGRDLDVIAP